MKVQLVVLPIACLGFVFTAMNSAVAQTRRPSPNTPVTASIAMGDETSTPDSNGIDLYKVTFTNGTFGLPAGSTINGSSFSVGSNSGGLTYTANGTQGGMDLYTWTASADFVPKGTYTATATITYTPMGSTTAKTVSNTSAAFNVPSP